MESVVIIILTIIIFYLILEKEEPQIIYIEKKIEPGTDIPGVIRTPYYGLRPKHFQRDPIFGRRMISH